MAIGRIFKTLLPFLNTRIEEGRELFKTLIVHHGIPSLLETGHSFDDAAAILSDAVLTRPKDERKKVCQFLSMESQSDSKTAALSLETQVVRATWKAIQQKQ